MKTRLANTNVGMSLEKKNGERVEKPFVSHVWGSDVTIIYKPKSESNSTSDSGEFTTKNGKKGHRYNGITYIEDTLIVNKTYSLPESYGNGLTIETTKLYNNGDWITLEEYFGIDSSF